MNWINTKDQYPEEGMEVLFFYHGSYHLGFFCGKTETSKTDVWESYQEDSYDNCPTNVQWWCELPENPNQ